MVFIFQSCLAALRNLRPPSRQQTRAPVELSLHELPSGDTWLADASVRLPTICEIHEKAAQDGTDLRYNLRPKPVRFPELGIIVKWGVEVTVAEGQCLWFLGARLSDEVPVPRVHGWTKHNSETFLYLELIEAPTLATAWPDMSKKAKQSLCVQLRFMIAAWRRVKRVSQRPGLCNISEGGSTDIMFQDIGNYPAGPFTDVRSFHDSLSEPVLKRSSHKDRSAVPVLRGLADDVDVCFSHADLDLSNILVTVSDNRSVKIVAIIDWHQSGWYPEPWDMLKARTVAEPHSEWEREYLPRVFDPVDSGYFKAWEFISMAII